MVFDYLPDHIPPCAANLLARPQWFADPTIVTRARLCPATWFARLISSRRFTRQNIHAIALRRTIHLRSLAHYDPHSARGLALLAHELKHVEQYERYGLVMFYARYLRDFVSSGYGEGLSFEAEAYQFQRCVQTHLQQEFDANPGRVHCLELADPHTPNADFVKQTPAPFVTRP